MKMLKLSLLSTLFVLAAQLSFAQTKTETFKVLGECGSCKKKIETAAKSAGADYAVWNKSSKIITVKYNSTATDEAKIQQAIAGAGYDTPAYKATDDAYNNLDDCCKYDRMASAAKAAKSKAMKSAKDCAKPGCSKKA